MNLIKRMWRIYVKYRDDFKMFKKWLPIHTNSFKKNIFLMNSRILPRYLLLPFCFLSLFPLPSSFFFSFFPSTYREDRLIVFQFSTTKFFSKRFEKIMTISTHHFDINNCFICLNLFPYNYVWCEHFSQISFKFFSQML